MAAWLPVLEGTESSKIFPNLPIRLCGGTWVYGRAEIREQKGLWATSEKAVETYDKQGPISTSDERKVYLPRTFLGRITCPLRW